MKIALQMTGCKNNRYELDQVLNWAISKKIPVVRPEEADYCIINTCTVTHVADRKSRQLIRRTKNNNPNLKTIVFGCAARMQKEDFQKINEIDYMFNDLREVMDFLEQVSIPIRRDAINRVSTDGNGRSRPLIQIQDGCDNYCTYCIIATARGRSKNRSIKKIINEINEYVENGYSEIVLTGINIGAYGASVTTKSDENTFADLLQNILDKTNIQRIRLSSLGPQYFNNKWYSILKNPRICRHIHLSIQSGSSSVLERMRRQYAVSDVEKIIQRLKSDIPGIAITTDIIVGFPEETDNEFQETVDFIKHNQLAKVHIFPYSIRQNTAAAKMKQVSDEVKKERAKKLQTIADTCRQEFIKNQIGTEVSVLWEKEVEPGVLEGITDNYIRVQKKGPAKLIRSIEKEVLSLDNVI